MRNDETVEAVLEKFEEAGFEMQVRLHDRDPQRVRELVYRLADIIDEIACMEEPEEDEDTAGVDDPMSDSNYVGHPVHY
jgi:hypothetical protein